MGELKPHPLALQPDTSLSEEMTFLWTTQGGPRNRTSVPQQTFIKAIFVHVSVHIEVFSRREREFCFGVFIWSIKRVITAGRTQAVIPPHYLSGVLSDSKILGGEVDRQKVERTPLRAHHLNAASRSFPAKATSFLNSFGRHPGSEKRDGAF